MKTHHAPHEQKTEDSNTSERAGDTAYDCACVGSTGGASGRGRRWRYRGRCGERDTGVNLGNERGYNMARGWRLIGFRHVIFRMGKNSRARSRKRKQRKEELREQRRNHARKKLLMETETKRKPEPKPKRDWKRRGKGSSRLGLSVPKEKLRECWSSGGVGWM